MMSSIQVLLLLAIIAALSSAPTNVDAFQAVSLKSRASSVVVAALPKQKETFAAATTTTIQQTVSKMTAAIITANSLLVPIVQAIVEDDNYEYGAVDAPIGIAVGGGILAILTALLPIALKGGEEAFEEIKDRDVDTFGKRNTDLLKKKK